MNTLGSFTLQPLHLCLQLLSLMRAIPKFEQLHNGTFTQCSHVLQMQSQTLYMNKASVLQFLPKSKVNCNAQIIHIQLCIVII